MDYPKFQLLLREGEKNNVDFKIQCDAFACKELMPKAELARDICAMANNGNLASYVIVGVSDDGLHFRSVSNPNLIDDNLQDFCRRAIFPPPKVKLQRKVWKNASLTHAGKEFVIIQVGPQPRQTFRLAQDFINYAEQICYRRHEVWIRRGATTDLATPEEVLRLATGQSLQEDEDDRQRRIERESFARASPHEQRVLINSAAISSLQAMGYVTLPGKYQIPLSISLQLPDPQETGMLWKRRDTTIVLVSVLLCSTGLTQTSLKKLAFRAHLPDSFVEWCQLPKPVTKLTRSNVEVVRRVCIVPVIGSVPVSRIARALPDLRRTGPFLHYYRTRLDKRGQPRNGQPDLLPSSGELLVLDKIRSVADFSGALTRVVVTMEGDKTTIIIPVNE